jgi:hypothetical protein
MFIPLPLGHTRRIATAVALFLLSRPSEAQDLSGLGVGLRGRYMADSLGQTELLAMVEVGTTLDALPSQPAPSSSREPEGAGQADVAVDEGEAAALADPGKDELLDSEPPPVSRTGRRRESPRVLLELERCPMGLVAEFVARLVAAAGRAQGLDQSWERLESQSSRSHTSAWLPDLRLRAGRDVDQSLRLAPTTDDPYRYTQSGGVSYVYEATVGWRLGRLVFSSEELGIERIRLAQLRERERLRETLLPRLFAWQDALCLSMVRSQSRTAQRRLLELEIELDQLSGGWFSVHKSGASRRLASPVPAPAAEGIRPPLAAVERPRPVSTEHFAAGSEGSTAELAAAGVSR